MPPGSFLHDSAGQGRRSPSLVRAVTPGLRGSRRPTRCKGVGLDEIVGVEPAAGGAVELSGTDLVRCTASALHAEPAQRREKPAADADLPREVVARVSPPMAARRPRRRDDRRVVGPLLSGELHEKIGTDLADERLRGLHGRRGFPLQSPTSGPSRCDVRGRGRHRHDVRSGQDRQDLPPDRDGEQPGAEQRDRLR
jgi:hypothetical protein